MFKRASLCSLSLAVSLAFSATAAFAQDKADAPKTEAPAALSLDSLMVEPPKAPEPFTIDEKILTPPENASFDEYFEFIEGLQTKLPVPKNQQERFAVVDAFSKTCLTVANKLLAMELTPEQRERAVQLKVVALTTRANIDEEAADQLDAFVEENLKNAKTDEELIKAYQLKLQVIDASSDDSIAKIEKLADEMFALDKKDLQIFALEVKAQAFLANVQRTGEIDKNLLEFVDGVIKDEKRDQAVREKALEIKLVAYVIASELEKEKDEAEQDKSYAEEAEKLFESLLTPGKYSLDLRKMVCQLRVQTLLDPNTTDEKATEKLEALVEQLTKDEDKELYALGVAVKGELLLNAARKDKNAVDALTEYAEKVYEQSKEKEELLGQAIGLKIQSFNLQEDREGLLAFVEEELAKDPNEDLKPKLDQVKLSVVTDLITKDPSAFDKHAEYIAELGKDEANADAVSTMYVARFVGSLNKIAENDGSLDDFNAALKQFKQDILTCPSCVGGLLFARSSIVEIGKKNNKEDLFDTTFEDILNFCKVADNEEVNAYAQQLESYQEQMQAIQKQLQEKAAADAKGSEDASGESEDAQK